MREQLMQRLSELRTEYEAGQKMPAELEAKQANLRETLWRISGALQVLEEELAKAAPPARHDLAPEAGTGAEPASPEALSAPARVSS